MPALVTDRAEVRRLIARRRRLGHDRYDEVWDGVYVVAPIADNEHQGLGSDLSAVFAIAIKWAGLGKSFQGVNISDRKEGWSKNYRVPDIAVFLSGNAAEDCGEFWFGGPDFAIEIVSPRDRTRKKIPFYEAVGTRELLIADRRPWRLTLLRLTEGSLVEVGQSSWDDPQLLASEVVPLSFRLVGNQAQPAIEVVHHDGHQRWIVAASGRSPK